MNFSYLRTKTFAGFATLIAAFLFAGAIFAQSGTSGISGTVTDQAGAVVPGATVTLTSLTTGLSRSVVTNNSGTYAFSSIQPSGYRLEVTANGFKKLVNNEIQARVDSPIRFDAKLETGDVSIVVDVTTGTIESVINTSDATIGNNFVAEQITQLPTDLRRVNDLLTLQPGVTRDGYVAGGRSDQANITLDGVDINDQQTGGRAGGGDLNQGSALRATTESIEEFRITTLGANANQGRSSGAQVSLITKSGSNSFKGSAFYFNRPTAFSANNFFSNLAGVERPEIERHVYGGTLGGPIKKDKLFFFYSYEGQNDKPAIPVNRVVPLPHVGRGELRFGGTGPSCVNGNCAIQLAEFNQIYTAVNGANPVALGVLAGAAARYPSNNTIVGDGLNTGGFQFNSPTNSTENTHIGRLDWTPNSSHQLFLRGNYQWDNSVNTSQFPDTAPTKSWSHPYGFVVGHNWTISSNRINNFRYGFTRQAFTNFGDSERNAITFRFVYQPEFFARTLERVTPVQNFTNDFTWIKNDHTVQVGGNVRIIRNNRVSLGSAYDNASLNPSWYASSGNVVNARIAANGYAINGGDISSVQAAATSIIGRLAQYTGQYNYDIDGNTVAIGTPVERTFATEEYDTYIQDVWKAHRTLTLTFGLRYGLSRPVYEKNGFQVKPNIRLGDYFEQRQRSAALGIPYNELLQFELAGPKNNADGWYSLDTDNLQPRFAAAWTPNVPGKIGRFLFGNEGDSVLRGGFGISNDYFGGQLAVAFDGLSTLGFTTSTTIGPNTHNVTSRPAPLFTGFNQQIRTLPLVSNPPNRFFTPDNEVQRIESSLDGTIESPTHYTWNVSFGRSLPKGIYVEASYIGRKGRNLFGARDVMALNNLVDPQSGMDWYTAAGILYDARKANVPIESLGSIPFFENLFPDARTALSVFELPGLTNTQAIYALASRDGFNIDDWTFIQLIIDDETEFGLNGNPGLFPNMFFHPQYAAFSAFGTFANSDYHGATFSLRQRLGSTLSYDFNYTFSKSMDDVSGLQTDGSYGGQFLLNPLRQRDNYSVSDFDSKHVINANFSFDLPIGKGRKYFSDLNSFADAVLGGWSLRGIYRFNTGGPISTPFDGQIWATNWNVQSNGVRIRALNSTVDRDTQNIFANPQEALNSFRNARPGETGERNTLRLPGYQTMDMGLSKSFKMPWKEGHEFQFRWEVFNVTNVQYFAAGNFTRASYGLPSDPEDADAPNDFGRIFSDIQGNPRRMQFAFRYSF